MKVKPALYALDENQTYDLLWASNLNTTHFNYLSNELGRFWLLPYTNLREFPKFLIERYTPYRNNWAVEWAEKTFEFLKLLSRYGVYDNPFMTGQAQGIDKPLKLKEPISVIPSMPSEIEFFVPKNEKVVITWLGYAHPEYLGYRHPNIEGQIGVINQFRKEVIGDGNPVLISTRGMLINSVVMTGNCSLITDSELIKYEQIDNTYNLVIDKGLQLSKPQILTSFKCQQNHTKSYHYFEDWDDYYDGYVWRHEFNDFEVTNASFSDIPEHYHYASLIWANNNYWKEEKSHRLSDLGKEITIKWEWNSLTFKLWDIGDYSTQVNPIELTTGGQYEELASEWRITDKKAFPESFNGFNGTYPYVPGEKWLNPWKGWNKNRHTSNWNWSRDMSQYRWTHELYRGINYQNSQQAPDYFQERFVHFGHANTGYHSYNVDPCLIKSYSRFVWWPFLNKTYIYEPDNNEWGFYRDVWKTGQSDKVYLSEVFISIRETFKQDEDNQLIFHQSLEKQQKTGELIYYNEYRRRAIIPTSSGITNENYDLIHVDLFNPPIEGMPPQKFKETLTKEYDFQLELQTELKAIEGLSQEDLTAIIANLPDNYNPERWYIMPDSIRLKEIHCALNAGKFCQSQNNEPQPIVANLGYYIERIARILGISVNPDGSIRSIRQSVHVPMDGIIPPGWPLGQWGRNNGGSQSGQPGGLEGEQRDGIAYEVIGNRFGVDPYTGKPNNIEQGGFILCENIPQLLEILKDDFNKCLGMSAAAANVIPNAQGTDYITYEGLHRLLTEVAYNQSALSENGTKAMVSGMVNQAVLQELIKQMGLPLEVGDISIKVNGEKAKIPYPKFAKDAPTLFNLISVVWTNLGHILGSVIGWPKPKEKLEEIPETTHPELQLPTGGRLHNLFDLSLGIDAPPEDKQGDESGGNQGGSQGTGKWTSSEDQTKLTAPDGTKYDVVW